MLLFIPIIVKECFFDRRLTQALLFIISKVANNSS